MKRKTPSVPESEIQEWIDLHSEKARLEAETVRLKKRMGELKETIEPYLEKQPEQALSMFGWRLKLVESSSSSFDLSTAKEKLGEKALAPFISKKPYTFIKPTFQGGEEEAAA